MRLNSGAASGRPIGTMFSCAPSVRTIESALVTDIKNVFFRCVEDCSEAIMITDLAGRLVYVNPAWTRIYGYSKEDALGQTPRLLHSGYQRPTFYKDMWDTILNPRLGHWKGEVTNRAKDGTLIPALLTITPYRNPANEIIGHMGIALDMSSQKLLEAKVLQQDRLASIGVLASGLAHEVGTPLGVVRGRAEYLSMQPESKQSPILGAGLQTIMTQIDRITGLISTLLRFSRATDDVCNQDVELTAVVGEVNNLVGQSLKASSIELKTEIPRGTRVLADFNRLQQVLLNLIVNSLHAIQEASRKGIHRDHAVTIRAERAPGQGGASIAITVADTGCGIPAENLKKVFQPFFTTKDVGHGTGLGLAIVSKLVNEMNGDITLESVLGQGATFTIHLRTAA